MLEIAQDPQKKNALGYLRISDKKQIEGESRDNQEDQIQKYADANNIKIIQWFYDEAKSGKNTDRDELQNLLKTALKMKGKIDYVIVYKMNRASRDIDSYITNVRGLLSSRGIQVRSATEHFDDSPSGRFMESMHVLVGQLDNDNKRETTVDNMRRLAKQGYWQHGPPRGYKIKTTKNSEGKPRPTLEPSDESEKVTQIILRFNRGDITLAELCRYATAKGFLNKNGMPVSQEVITKMVERAEYAGYLSDKFTDYELVEGKHRGLISKEVYWQNQEFLKRKSKPYLIGLKHNRINYVAPLSRFILCSNCHKYMTRSNPGGDYRYYCPRESCRGLGSITVGSAHTKFAELLERITPKPSTLKLMKEILVRTSLKELGNISNDLAELRSELDAISNTRANAIKKYVNNQLSEEDKQSIIDDLDTDKLEVTVKISELEKHQLASESSIEYALNFMEQLAKQWSDADFELKQKFQNLIFPEGFEYDIRNDNFIISKISPLYGVVSPEMEADFDKNSVLASPRVFF
jgi:DNA invertase Pin-like site-specific DNA recombinase